MINKDKLSEGRINKDKLSIEADSDRAGEFGGKSGVIGEGTNLDSVIGYVGNICSSASDGTGYRDFTLPVELKWDFEARLFDIGSVIGDGRLRKYYFGLS